MQLDSHRSRPRCEHVVEHIRRQADRRRVEHTSEKAQDQTATYSFAARDHHLDMEAFADEKGVRPRRESKMTRGERISLIAICAATLYALPYCMGVYNYPTVADWLQDRFTLELPSSLHAISRPVLPAVARGPKLDLSKSCKQQEPLVPRYGSFEDVMRQIRSQDYQNKSAAILSQSVTCPTVSFDDLGDVDGDKQDGRWLTREPFIKWLSKAFPAVHETMTLERVNTLGLVYTWPGSDPTLKPTVLMAHYDVVPVPAETLDAWSHPPFDGVFDGEFVWGRGSSDDKNQLTAILEACTLLIDAKFTPRRTIVLSFGADEEISGAHIAQPLGNFLVDRYGENGAAVIVDEGAGFATLWGNKFAVLGVGEKGHLNVRVTLEAPGGHSSVPPPHTAIGVAAALIRRLERHTYLPRIVDDNPVLPLLKCAYKYADDFPKEYGKLLDHRKSVSGPIDLDVFAPPEHFFEHEHPHYGSEHEQHGAKHGKHGGHPGHGKHGGGKGKHGPHGPHGPHHGPPRHGGGGGDRKPADALAQAFAEREPALLRYLVQTSLAVDTISGGIKVNALPEKVSLVVNHRINIGETVHDVLAKVQRIATWTAREFDYELKGFTELDDEKNGDGAAEATEAQPAVGLTAVKRRITLETDNKLEPAPVTPIDTPVWDVLSGTIQAVFGSHATGNDTALASDSAAHGDKAKPRQELVVAPGLMTGNTDTRWYWKLSDNIFRFNPSRLEGLGAIHTVDEKMPIQGHLDAVAWMWTFLRNMDELL